MDFLIRKDQPTKLLVWMWWSIACYILLLALKYWVYPLRALPHTPLILLPVVCVAIMARLIRFRSDTHTRTARVLVWILLAVTGFMYLYSAPAFLFWPNYLSEYLFLPYLSVLLLLMPATALFKSFLIASNHLIKLGCVLAIVPVIIYTDNAIIQQLYESVVLIAGLIVLTNKYHSSKTFTWALICLCIGLLVATITARRNLMVSIALYLMIVGVRYIFGNKIKSMATRLFAILSMAVIVITGTLFFLYNQQSMFSNITERATENTREYVFMNFALDMANPTDLTIGRSMAGTYQCQGVQGEEFEEGERPNIECGYLQLILKGGILYLFIYMTVIIYAIVKGFKAKNQLLGACAWMLVVQLIDMLPFGLHAFNVKTFMLWMCIALCFDKHLWTLNDQDIQDTLYAPDTSLPQWGGLTNKR